MTPTIQKTFFSLGTVNTLSVPAEQGKDGLRLALQRVRELDDRLSVFKETSEISRINAAAGRRFVSIHPDTMHLLKTAISFSRQSNGAFDVTARPLVELWGIGKKGTSIPPASEIARIKELVHFPDLVFSEQDSSVMLTHPGQSLDLGAIAKGYAADEVKRIFLENGITDALINLGGTVIAMGAPRSVGIQHPLQPTGTPMGRLTLANQSVVTSGSYEKCFFKDGIRYHHILDPRTGYPSQSGLLSVSILGASAMELDALTTAVFVLGQEEGLKLMEQNHLQAIFVDDALAVFTTAGLQDRFSLIKNI